MLESGQINVNDRVLLHLSRFATDIPPEEYPPETTQGGIASAVGISRTHVPRAVKGLIKDGLVSELTARVMGHERRINVYAVTAEGLKKSEEFWQSAQNKTFSVMRNGILVTMSGKDMEAILGKRKAVAAISQMTDGIVVVEDRKRMPIRDLVGAPALGEFYGRDTELRTMDAFIDSERPVLVILANRGYGTTALVRKFVETRDDLDVLWMPLTHAVTTKNLETRIVEFAKKIDKRVETLPDSLGIDGTVYVFDDYFSVGEEMVEFFSSLAETTDGAKLIITARQETPAYNWFYHKEQVDKGKVEELRISGLDLEGARKLLGNDKIEKEALRRILGMTRGQPMTLKMLRDGDYEGLKKTTVFTAEEIRYLLLLKEKTE